MFKKVESKICALPLWAAIVYSITVLLVSITLLISPCILLMPVLGRVSAEDREFAREDWALCKEYTGMDAAPIDWYMNIQLAIGDKVWYSSIFETVRGATGLMAVAVDAAHVMQAVSDEYTATGSAEITPEMFPEAPDSRNVLRYLSHVELSKLAYGGVVDLSAVNKVVEMATYLSLFYTFTGIFLSRLFIHKMPSPLVRHFALWLKARRERKYTVAGEECFSVEINNVESNAFEVS